MRTTWITMRVLAVAIALAAVGCDRSATVYDEEERGDPALQLARSKRSVPDQAIEAYRQILDRNPTMAHAHLDLALLLHDSAKDYVGAIYHYRRYLELRKDAQKASMIAGRIQDATRRFILQSQGKGQVTNMVAAGLSVDTARLVDENASLKIEVARLTQELESLGTDGPARAPAADQSSEKPAASGDQLRARQHTPKPVAVVKPRVHTVRQKETLLSIAGEVYGDRNQWKRILDANSVQLRGEPKRLREGMELTIP